MRQIPKVALLIETSRGFGREMLRGIARYAQLNGPWSIHITAGDYEQVVPKMKSWGGMGIIARIPNERVAKAIVDADVPTIAIGLTDEQMSPDSPLSKFSELSSDPDTVAKMAADYLLEKRFRHFAYVGIEGRSWSTRRQLAFSKYLAEAGREVHVYPQPLRKQDRHWESEQAIMANWIGDLPKPLGLLACNDDRGRQVLEACSLAELRVPEDVAAIGVDDDEVFCTLANPPLSSVALNAETAGYRAAELLDAMMQGRVLKPRRILVEALRVVTRRSTDIVAVDDQDVAAAIQYIHNHQGRHISVADVADEVAVSRRNLEKRFRKSIGRTILEEIQIARLDLAKQLLLETSHPISRVAEISGFGSTGYFINFFQSRVGQTPQKFRVALAT
jgi:LacI family transcriptional regulator